jgi:hypothetical protein
VKIHFSWPHAANQCEKSSGKIAALLRLGRKYRFMALPISI